MSHLGSNGKSNLKTPVIFEGVYESYVIPSMISDELDNRKRNLYQGRCPIHGNHLTFLFAKEGDLYYECSEANCGYRVRKSNKRWLMPSDLYYLLEPSGCFQISSPNYVNHNGWILIVSAEYHVICHLIESTDLINTTFSAELDPDIRNSRDPHKRWNMSFKISESVLSDNTYHDVLNKNTQRKMLDVRDQIDKQLHSYVKSLYPSKRLWDI